MVLETDGWESCVAAGSTVASTALAHAGIEMFGITVGCSAVMVGEEVWLDPTAEECEGADCGLVVACMPALGTITNVRYTGNASPLLAMKVDWFHLCVSSLRLTRFRLGNRVRCI